jgi:hypothetical protein
MQQGSEAFRRAGGLPSLMQLQEVADTALNAKQARYLNHKRARARKLGGHDLIRARRLALQHARAQLAHAHVELGATLLRGAASGQDHFGSHAAATG